jgi:hypothetical protein
LLEHRKLSKELEKSENTRQIMVAENENELLKDKITELENFKVLYLESKEKIDKQDSVDKVCLINFSVRFLSICLSLFIPFSS